ncbi:MAG: hypothetical protein HKM00_08385 [Gallionella sp.]|jgi:hypothetical protein|nr:hypothetical protein [Gallionella sp.]
MLAYFPKIYPGELLYSMLARYHLHVGSPGTMHTLDTLFGNRKAISTFDLPGHLQVLTDRIPPECNLSVDRIIDTLTLFPYFTAFEPPSLQKKVRSAMRSGTINGLHVRLGLSAFRIGRIQRLRFCPVCIPGMQAAHGELWWCRDHQLPGILVCPEHGCLLRESAVSFSQFSRHEFVAATPRNCSPHARPVVSVMDHACLAHLLRRVARRSADLLCGPPAPRTLSRWTLFYRSHMLEVGLAKSISTMDQHRFDSEFRNFYGGVLDLLPSVMDGGDFAGDWLASMVRKHRKANHPLYHVLLQDFLAQRERQVSPFGAGPWPCINPLASHSSQPLIKTLTQHRNRGNRVGVFSCTCGYVYTRCLNSQTGELGLPRFLHYGPLLEPALRQLVMASTGLRKVGRSLRLDPKTVVRLASELGVAVSWKPRPFDKTLRAMPKVAAQSAPPLSHATHAISASRDMSSRTRREWAEIDRVWAAKLSAVTDIVRAETPPVRITVAELERRVNQRGWLLKRRHRLPQTMAFLERAVEITKDFQLRRIYWAVAELERCGVQVKAWQIMRKAGLRSNSLGRINAILDAVPILSRRAA